MQAKLINGEGNLEPTDSARCFDAPVGLEHALAAALRHVAHAGARPLLFAGPVGVGKSTCAMAIAERLGRPVLAFDVAVSGLRLGQRDGLRELPLISRSVPEPKNPDARGAPLILIEQAERLPGGLVGNVMAALAIIATERCPKAIEHYFGIQSGWDEVIFAFTTSAVVSPTLETSLFVLELHGYFRAQKLKIAKQMLEAAGRQLSSEQVEQLIHACLHGPGVAELTPLILATRELSDQQMVPERIAAFAGKHPPSVLAPYASPCPGQAIAMAWTHEGGTQLVIEVCFGSPGDTDLTVLGHVGEVMQDSARIALHVVNQCLDESQRLGAVRGRPVLMNLPGSWAHRKDGQSAGLAMGLAMYGLATGRGIHPRLAVTGELSLGGLVLPVHGCVVKLIAADREAIEQAIFPSGNRTDLERAPGCRSSGLKICLVELFSEALGHSFD